MRPRLKNSASGPRVKAGKKARAAITTITASVIRPNVPVSVGSVPDDLLFSPTDEDGRAEFYCFERLRAVKDRPVFFEKLILPNRYLPNFPRQRLANRSFFDLLRAKYGLVVTGGEQKIQALPADSPVSIYLGVAEGSPVLRLEKRIDTNNRIPAFHPLPPAFWKMISANLPTYFDLAGSKRSATRHPVAPALAGVNDLSTLNALL